MDEQVAAGKTQMEERCLQNVEKGARHLGGIQECCESLCRDATRKIKANLEQNLARDVKDYKKDSSIT